ncbi:MAG: hypothetical protein RR344_00730 [Cetobacterium sp.]
MIFLPFLKYDNLKITKLKYEKEKVSLSNSKRKLIDSIEIEKSKIQIKKDKEKETIKDYEKKIFESQSEGLTFLSQLLIHYNIELLVVGREDFLQLNSMDIQNKIFFNILGEEESIYRFIKTIDDSNKNITFIKEGVLLEKKENYLELKANVMYISKNKKTEIKYYDYNYEIFKKKNKREFGKKRRVL